MWEGLVLLYWNFLFKRGGRSGRFHCNVFTQCWCCSSILHPQVCLVIPLYITLKPTPFWFLEDIDSRFNGYSHLRSCIRFMWPATPGVYCRLNHSIIQLRSFSTPLLWLVTSWWCMVEEVIPLTSSSPVNYCFTKSSATIGTMCRVSCYES